MFGVGSVQRVGALLGVLALLLSGCASSPKPRVFHVGGEAFDLTGLSPARAEVVIAGLSQIGTPYVFGGSEPGRALDCSGLTRHAHQAAGLEIPRVSTAQQAAARPLRDDPKPGDLVFFRTGPNQYHVGLMVDRYRFVHASTSLRRVHLASLDNSYWRQRYLGAGTYLH
ncbi:MAG: NlpC/P60 family protein [Chromatiaceae bacterium]|nr:MAG: NlpC/P60 family protein [Chromatiaceae bacterium]